MQGTYISQLIEYLHDTQIYDQAGRVYADDEAAMQQLAAVFIETRRSKNQVFFIGNGGSAAIASHMTADFMKNGGMKTCSLYDSSLLTCMGNDYGYEAVFSSPLELLAEAGDLLVAVSSSGNSPNIVHAVETARSKGMRVITFSGFAKDNRIIQLGDYNVYVPVSHYGMVESIHNLILQQLVDYILEQDKS